MNEGERVGREGGGRVMIEEVDRSVNRKAWREKNRTYVSVDLVLITHFKELVSALFSLSLYI